MKIDLSKSAFFLLMMLNISAYAQTYTTEDGKRVKIVGFNDNPDDFPHLFMSVGLCLDNVKFRSGPLMQTHKFIHVSYLKPGKLFINADLGPVNASLDGSYFFHSSDKEKERTITVKNIQREDYVERYNINRPVKTRYSFGSHTILGFESVRLDDGTTILGEKSVNYTNLGVGVSFIVHRHVGMNVDGRLVKNVEHLFRTNLDVIGSFPSLDVSSNLYGGRFDIGGRINTVNLTKVAISVNYKAGISITRGGEGYEAQDVFFGPIYCFGLGLHFK